MTVSPEIRVLASTLAQTLSRKLQMLPKETLGSATVEAKVSIVEQEDKNFDSETKEHKDENNEIGKK